MSTSIAPVTVVLLVIAMAPGLAFATDDAPPSAVCLECHGEGSAPEVRKESSHPLAIDYDSAQRRLRFLRPSTEPSGFGGTIREDLLVDGRVECVSCHVTHEEWTDARYRLRTPTVTAICIVCHDMRNAHLMRSSPSAKSGG